MNKQQDVVWVDLETTGLKAGHHGIVEMAMMFEKDGKIVEEWSTKVNCGEYDRDVACDQVALNINKTKLSDIAGFPLPTVVLEELDHKLVEHYGRTRVGLAGFNVSSFDKLFLDDFYKSNGWNYWQHFHHKPIDVFELYKCLQYMGVMPHTYNQKLTTLVQAFGLATQAEIDEQAHGALWDIQMTRQLWLLVEDKFIKARLIGGR